MRTVYWASQDGRVHELTLSQLIVARIMTEIPGGTEMSLEELTLESVAMVERCLNEGWFSREEWIEQWLADADRSLEDDLAEIWPGGMVSD